AAAYGKIGRLREILDADPSRANDIGTGLSPLGWCGYGDQHEAARILIEYGAAIDADAWAPAAHVANVKIARVLLDGGGDPNCRNDDGDTPLHLVVKSRLVRDPSSFIGLLLSRGADPGIRNRQGRTALDEAHTQIGLKAHAYFPAREIG